MNNNPESDRPMILIECLAGIVVIAQQLARGYQDVPGDRLLDIIAMRATVASLPDVIPLDDLHDFGFRLLPCDWRRFYSLTHAGQTFKSARRARGLSS